MIPASEPAYVAAVLMLYTDLPDTPLRPSPQDQVLARWLHQQGVPLSLVESALLPASLRSLARPNGIPPLPRIRSLAYFRPVIAELQQQPRRRTTWITSGSSFSRPPNVLPNDAQKKTFPDDRQHRSSSTPSGTPASPAGPSTWTRSRSTSLPATPT